MKSSAIQTYVRSKLKNFSIWLIITLANIYFTILPKLLNVRGGEVEPVTSVGVPPEWHELELVIKAKIKPLENPPHVVQALTFFSVKDQCLYTFHFPQWIHLP